MPLEECVVWRSELIPDRNRDGFRKLYLLAVVGLASLLGGCRGLVASAPVDVNTPQGINQVNHIIFMAQENRGFDHYFGAMRQYWAANGIADQSFDGLPQFNPTTGAAPLQGPPPPIWAAILRFLSPVMIARPMAIVLQCSPFTWFPCARKIPALFGMKTT